MAKSRRFQPGDSAPDFSHLADHDQESDEPQWTPAGDAPDASDSAAEDPQPAAPQTSPQPKHAADDVPAKSPGGDSHVFFEADEPVSEEDLAGETTAYTPSHQQRSDEEDQAAAEVLGSEPEVDDPPLDVASDEATGLTDVGIPAFVDPPLAAETTAAEPPSTSDADAAIDKEPAADAPQIIDVETTPKPAPAAPARTPDSVPRKKQKSRPAARPKRAEASEPPAGDDRRRLMMILLASYASAMTLGFLWLWLARNSARPHELESLPDVAPLGPNEFRYAPENASMPKGHTLPLGDEQQLGFLKVEPLRVTRGPVLFDHYSDATQSKPPSEPALKLWLRFTNVSSDQLIAPLDANLLLTRSYQVETDTVLANQLLLPADKSSQKPAFVLDHPTTSEWDLAGQQLGRRLKPGESLETYIPLEPGSDAHLQGDLLWRVHFRKGYDDATGHGVTTMIEVPFSTTDVQSESATAS